MPFPLLNKTVTATNISVVSSHQYNLNKGESVLERLNCESLEKQLHSALELESAKLIIKLLQKETDEDFPHNDRISEATKPPRDTSATVHSNKLENNKWTVIAAKCHRKGFSPKNLTEANNTYRLSTADCYKQLNNLQDTPAEDIILKAQKENNTSDIPNCDHQTKFQHQSRKRIQQIDEKHREDSQIYHIPTLLNGK